jgi:large subunit ribosomal protein L22
MKDQDKAKKISPVKDQKVDLLSSDEKGAAKSDKLVNKGRTEVKAKAHFLHISPRKVKLVIDLIRGMKVDEALKQLQFVNKKATRFVVKLINSAIANAENNFQIKKDNLYIKFIVANQGPTIHRFKPAAFGQAHPIRKRSTHLDLILGVKGAETVQKKDQAKNKKLLLKKAVAGSKADSKASKKAKVENKNQSKEGII